MCVCVVPTRAREPAHPNAPEVQVDATLRRDALAGKRWVDPVCEGGWWVAGWWCVRERVGGVVGGRERGRVLMLAKNAGHGCGRPHDTVLVSTRRGRRDRAWTSNAPLSPGSPKTAACPRRARRMDATAKRRGGEHMAGGVFFVFFPWRGGTRAQAVCATGVVAQCVTPVYDTSRWRRRRWLRAGGPG